METTGLRNRIQLSQATADLIAASGKSNWIQEREERVYAKGKGEVKTYWVKATSRVTAAEMESSTSSKASLPGSTVPKMAQDEAETTFGIRKSLIDWQVELLSRQLERIVQHRTPAKAAKLSFPTHCDTNKRLPRDEITDKFEMPAVDPGTATTSTTAPLVELPQLILAQLNHLVTTLAVLYHDNGFHNYEHACHVTMSANKLINRVVSTGRNSNGSLEHAHDYGILISDPLTQFAILFSALIHDIDHHGVSNQQLVKENNRLATVYQCKSVAEQNSIDLAFEVLGSTSYSELVGCICACEQEYKRFRQLVVNNVMATACKFYCLSPLIQRDALTNFCQF